MHSLKTRFAEKAQYNNPNKYFVYMSFNYSVCYTASHEDSEQQAHRHRCRQMGLLLKGLLVPWSQVGVWMYVCMYVLGTHTHTDPHSIASV